jgi:Ankyrin repeats (3 copies)
MNISIIFFTKEFSMKNIINFAILCLFLCSSAFTYAMEQEVLQPFPQRKDLIIYAGDERPEPQEFCQLVLNDSLTLLCGEKKLNYTLVQGVLNMRADVNIQRSATELRDRFSLKFGTNDSSMLQYQIFTPLSLAAQRNDVSLVELLIHGGADINLGEMKYGRTVLMQTLRSLNDVDHMVCCLIACKANIHAVDKYGFNALMYAAQSGHVGAVQALLHNHANVHAQSYHRNGCTALQVARERFFPGRSHYYEAIIRLLESAMQQ